MDMERSLRLREAEHETARAVFIVRIILDQNSSCEGFPNFEYANTA